jgi:hypothetical protein
MRVHASFIGFAVSLLALTAGCSGGSPGEGSGGEEGGSADPNGWTGRTNVEAIFESYCSGCHGTQWSTCWNVQASHGLVDSMISSGEMPRIGALTAPDKSTLLTWLAEGAPCEGTPPSTDGGGDGQDGGIAYPLPPIEVVSGQGTTPAK